MGDRYIMSCLLHCSMLKIYLHCIENKALMTWVAPGESKSCNLEWEFAEGCMYCDSLHKWMTKWSVKSSPGFMMVNIILATVFLPFWVHLNAAWSFIDVSYDRVLLHQIAPIDVYCTCSMYYVIYDKSEKAWVAGGSVKWPHVFGKWPPWFWKTTSRFLKEVRLYASPLVNGITDVYNM